MVVLLIACYIWNRIGIRDCAQPHWLFLLAFGCARCSPLTCSLIVQCSPLSPKVEPASLVVYVYYILTQILLISSLVYSLWSTTKSVYSWVSISQPPECCRFYFSYLSCYFFLFMVYTVWDSDPQKCCCQVSRGGFQGRWRLRFV